MEKNEFSAKIQEKLKAPADQLNLENPEIIKWAEDFYNKRVRNFKYYFAPRLNIFSWLFRMSLGGIRIMVVAMGFFRFLPPGMRNWEFFGLAENIEYRKNLWPSQVYRSYEEYAKFDIEREVPLFRHKGFGTGDGFLITNKYFYFKFSPSKKFKDVFKDLKTGKIELSKINSVDIKKEYGFAEVRINGELIGAYTIDCTQDVSVLRDFLNGLPK